jgi:seryl-tRNA synthetase
MLDIRMILEDREKVEKGLSKRMEVSKLKEMLDKIVLLYEGKKTVKSEYEKKRSEQNSFNQQMSQVEKGGEEFQKLLGNLKELSLQVKEVEEKSRAKDEELKSLLEVLPNIPEEDVVAGGKENNEIVKVVGEKPVFNFGIKDHVALGEDLDILDLERASKISGANFFMYKDKLAQLEWGLLNYFVQSHLKDGYEMIMPPHLVTEESAYTAGQLPKFKDDVYWTEDGYCLIPTAETVLSNIHRNEILDEKDLPKKYFAYTPCYRKEAGSYRANERGTIRVHQFNKVEMFQYTTPEKAGEALEELVGKAEKLVGDLGLHYRVAKLAAGDCSAAATKTFDIEVWLPSLEQYYEVSSASNVGEYQARRGDIRYRPSNSNGEKIKYVHMLNASGLATSRLMVSILETYQNEDGSINIPKVLVPFVGFDKIG